MFWGDGFFKWIIKKKNKDRELLFSSRIFMYEACS